MIWIWISVAVLLSYLFIRDKHVSIVHFIWILLPIDMYGFKIFGITVKPYMFFSIILLIMYLRNDHKKLFIGHITVPAILMGTLMVNFINGGTESSIMSIFMVALVYICACIYVSEARDCMNEIPETIVAASIGYGMVFSVAYILFSCGIILPGIVTKSSMLPGIMMEYKNMSGTVFLQIHRLRGFNIDPNASVGLFLAALPTDVAMIFMKRDHKTRYIISLAISLSCIVFTNSRMGIIAALVIVFMSGIRIMKIMPLQQKVRVTRVIILVLLLIMLVLLFSDSVEGLLENFISNYSNRSDFESQYGRGSIWKESIAIWQENGFIFGVGTENIQRLISTKRQTHNSWLEWLCGCGIVAGGAVIIFFFSLLLQGIKQIQEDKDKLLFQTIYMGLFGMCVCLFTVDNITNSYLWYFAVALMGILSLSSNHDTRFASRYLKK